jgi:cyclopropane fatty-acyl-phospholipid synthase-like methyltransferase
LTAGLFTSSATRTAPAYIDSVQSALVPDGRYFMLCINDQQPGDQGPRRMPRDEITTSFANGWRIDSIEPTTLDSSTDPAGIRAWLVALTKT